MQTSVIQFSDLDLGDRIDAEYFMPTYLHIEEKIKKQHFVYLREIADFAVSAFYPAATQLYESGDVPFSRCVDSINFPIMDTDREGDFAKIPNDFLVEYSASIKTVGKEDIIITKVGTPGYASLVYNFDTIALSRTVLGLKNIKINPYYLLVFLRSYYGFHQLQRQRELTIQYQLTVDRVGKVLVPIPPESFQKEIEKLVKESHKKQTLSKKLYREAEEMLLEELGLLDYKPKHRLTFTARKSEVDKAGRFDAEYFQSKYAEIIERIENYHGGYDIVGNIVNWKKGVEVGSGAYTEEGKDFVRVSDFTKFGVENVSKKISEELFESLKDDFQPKRGEILFTKDGTIGIASVVNEEIDGVVSGAFLRLTLKEKYKDFEKEVLAFIFNSIITKMQVEKLSGGALIAHLKPSDFEQFKIPLLSADLQTRLADKITQSHHLRQEAKNLLEKAKRKVEEWIEKKNKILQK